MEKKLSKEEKDMLGLDAAIRKKMPQIEAREESFATELAERRAASEEARATHKVDKSNRLQRSIISKRKDHEQID